MIMIFEIDQNCNILTTQSCCCLVPSELKVNFFFLYFILFSYSSRSKMGGQENMSVYYSHGMMSARKLFGALSWWGWGLTHLTPALLLNHGKKVTCTCMLITLGLSQNMDDSTSTGKLVNVEELLLLNAYYNLSQHKNNPHSLHKHITCILM